MSLIKRGLTVLRDEGLVTFLKQTLNYLLSKSGLSSGGYDYGSYPDYQKDRQKGNKIRWEMISPHITADSSVLDVGCNAGEMTSRAAKQGAFSIGIDVRPDTIAKAKEENGGEENIAFVHSEVTLDNIPSLPNFDAVFLLSVYHQWHKIYDSKTASEMLHGLGKNVTRTFSLRPLVRSLNMEMTLFHLTISMKKVLLNIIKNS